MGLQVWLPLNEDIHNQGLMNISFTNSNAVINNNGKIGKCYYFNISENSMIKNNNDIPTTNWNQGSLCCWVKLNTFPNDSTNPKWAPMLFLGTSGLYANSIFGLVFEYSNYINISIHGSTAGKNAYKHNLITDTWYHICTTYDGSIVKLYINGQEVMSKTATLGTFNSNLSTLYVGGNPSYILNGYLNDCRYYDHCLSPKEVEEISKGLILHYKFDDEYIESTKNIVPYPAPSNLNPSIAWDTTLHVDAIEVSNWTNGYNGGTTNPTVGYHAMWNIIDGIPTIVFQNHNRDYNMGNRWMGVRSDSVSEFIPAGAQYTISYEQKTIDTLGGWTTSGLYYKKTSSDSQNFHDGGVQKIGQNTKLNVWEKFSYTFTHNTAATNNSGNIGLVYIYGNNGSVDSTMLVRNVQLEIKDHSTPFTPNERNSSILYDSSGYQHDGAIIGNLLTTTSSPRYEVATYQDNGLNNYVKTDSIYLPTDACTMNIWIKSTNVTPTGNYHDPFCAYTTPGAFEMSIYKTGYLRAGLYISGTRKVDNCTSTKLLDGNWHMITLTYDGTTIKRYVDTVMEKSTAATGTLTSPMNFAFGRYGSGTTYGSKEMSYSDARFYATALTQEQINELYNTSAAVDNNGNIYARELVE